jgi:hypothetical protein
MPLHCTIYWGATARNNQLTTDTIWSESSTLTVIPSLRPVLGSNEQMHYAKMHSDKFNVVVLKDFA